MKKIKKSIKIFILANLACLILKILHMTQKWSYEFHPDVSREWPNEENFVIAFWHNKQLPMPWFTKINPKKVRKSIYVMISNHSDGRIIANAIRKVGVQSVAGSSSRGGQDALKGLIEKYKEGHSVAITPDGPRGPIYKAKGGILSLAEKTNATIYPITFAANRYWEFNSWDKMILAKPFSKGVFYVGKPIKVDIGTYDFEEKLLEIENEMIETDRVAKELCSKI